MTQPDPRDVDALVADLLYSHEVGLFTAIEEGRWVDPKDAATTITALQAEVAALRELAERGVMLVEDACEDTNWGQPTFVPDYVEEFRAEFVRLVALGQQP